ncbi:MAG: hypothetical protein JRI96_10450 [Deltaproteobacteria bacterium]|nr:hypothetical protein [Deltaproteobacteria bacterium]RLB32210.1 MAG: hypothetical protein DRH11_12180 [Deltaproteobacteria bacterium]
MGKINSVSIRYRYPILQKRTRCSKAASCFWSTAGLNQYYQSRHKASWDKPGARAWIDELEQKITQAFLQGDITVYVETVDRWEGVLKELYTVC